jgi:hypothetical protein
MNKAALGQMTSISSPALFRTFWQVDILELVNGEPIADPRDLIGAL